MRFLVLAALCLPAASSAAPPPAGEEVRAEAQAGSDCAPDPRLRTARPRGKPATINRLGDEPEAALILTVYRHVGRCHTPAILREGIGYTPGRAPSGE